MSFHRRQQTDNPFRAQATQLQEAFPSWSKEDLVSLLVEVNGDIEIAATRITEGQAVQWGSVTRKKDKKVTPSPADRGATRGARGGRGGARGAARGGARAPRTTNGHQTISDQPLNETPTTDVAWASEPPAPAVATEPLALPEAEPHINGSTKLTKTPATSKLSWAQIARPQEKPAPPPAPEPTPPEPAVLREPTPPPAEALEPETQSGWEEPTTVQPPSWDDEPQPKPPTIQTEAWLEPKPKEDSPRLEEPPAPEPVLSALPAQVQHQDLSRSSTPSTSGKRPSGAHRNSSRFKTTDQAVVMPNFVTTTEKIGMQFGSLSLAGEEIVDTEEIPEPAPRVEPEPEKRPVEKAPESPVVVEPPKTLTSSLFQQAIPQSSLASSISQPSLTTSATTSSISSPITPSFAQPAPQPSLASQHQSQHLAQQQQQQYMQHNLPSHLENHVQQSPHAPQAQAQQLGNSHQSYFRQAEAPYSYTPTPPAGQQDSPYGNFGQIGQQMHQQSQASHGGFNEYGYNDRNNFYDSYSGPTGFNDRNDQLKGLTAAQQQTHSGGLPPSSAQSSQQGAQGGAQPPPAGGQGPQQGYPHPVPYYYPFPQNQFYGTPYNSGYGVPQPFVKYPTMFQPGPPGPGSASPVAKQAPNPAQHSNPYAQSLYGQGQQQHPSNAYDDGGYPQHHSQHNAQSVGGGGLPGNDYGKQLYGHQSGIQNFMGALGQSGASGPNSAGAVPGAQRGSGGSPETAFKPYGPGKDLGQGVPGAPGRLGAGVSQQPGVPGAGFYGSAGAGGAGRFGSNVGGAGAGGPGQQQQNQGGHGSQGQGYPSQASGEGYNYSYQRGQQYWQ